MEYANIKNALITDIPRNRNISGYGSKIPTRYMVQQTESNRWNRVYCCIYSNNGTVYIISKGQSLLIDEFELEKALMEHKKLIEGI